MSLPQVRPTDAAVPQRVLGRCEYCGAALTPGYYFCLRCGTPHAAADSVLPHYAPIPLTDGELITQKAPHVRPLFFTYLAVVLGSALLSLVLFQEDWMKWGLWLQSAVFFVTTCVFVVMFRRTLTVQLSRLGFFRWEAWLGLAALVPLLTINYYYHTWIRTAAGVEFDPWPHMGLSRMGLTLFICILPAITEEIAFRGLVQHWLQVAIRPWRAILLASALFMALHFSVISAPYLFLLGMLLGWTKWRTGSLYPAMVIHFAHNYVVVHYFGS